MGIDDEHRWRIDRYNQLEVGCLKVAAAAATTTEVVTIIINSNTRTCVYYVDRRSPIINVSQR